MARIEDTAKEFIIDFPLYDISKDGIRLIPKTNSNAIVGLNSPSKILENNGYAFVYDAGKLIKTPGIQYAYLTPWDYCVIKITGFYQNNQKYGKVYFASLINQINKTTQWGFISEYWLDQWEVESTNMKFPRGIQYMDFGIPVSIEDISAKENSTKEGDFFDYDLTEVNNDDHLPIEENSDNEFNEENLLSEKNNSNIENKKNDSYNSITIIILISILFIFLVLITRNSR